MVLIRHCGYLSWSISPTLVCFARSVDGLNKDQIQRWHLCIKHPLHHKVIVYKVLHKLERQS